MSFQNNKIGPSSDKTSIKSEPTNFSAGRLIQRSKSQGSIGTSKQSVPKPLTSTISLPSIQDVSSDVRGSFVGQVKVVENPKSVMAKIKTKPSSMDKLLKDMVRMELPELSKDNKKLFISLSKEFSKTNNPQELKPKIDAFKALMSKPVISGSKILKNEIIKSLFKTPNSDIGLLKSLISKASEVLPDKNELKKIVSMSEGDKLSTVQGKFQFSVKLQVSSGVLPPNKVDDLREAGVITNNEFSDIMVDSVKTSIKMSNFDRAKAIISATDDVPVETQNKLAFLTKKIEVVQIKNDLVSELSQPIKKGMVDVHFNVIQSSIDKLDEQISELDQLEGGQDLKTDIKNFKSELKMQTFKASLYLAKSPAFKGDKNQQIQNVKDKYVESLDQDIKGLTTQINEKVDDLNNLGLTGSKLKIGRSKWDSFKSNFVNSKDINKAVSTIIESENELAGLYKDFTKVSGSKGKIRNGFVRLFSKDNNAEKADKISKKVIKLESTIASKIQIISNESKNAPKEVRQDLKKFIDTRNELGSLREQKNALQVLKKATSDDQGTMDIGRLTRNISKREKLAKPTTLEHSKTAAGNYSNMKSKLEPLNNAKIGQEIVINHKGFIGAASDLPCGGNMLVQVEADVFVKGEMRVSKTEDGKIRVVQNLMEGVETKANTLGGFFGAAAHVGAINQTEIIFDDLDTAIRELSNMKGIIKSDTKISKTNSINTGTTVTFAGVDRNINKFNLTTLNGEKKTRIVQDIDCPYNTIGATGKNLGVMAVTAGSSLLATSFMEGADIFGVLGLNRTFGNKVDLHIESEKNRTLENDDYKVTDNSKVDIGFKAQEIVAMRQIKSPESREAIKKALIEQENPSTDADIDREVDILVNIMIETKAQDLANMIERNITWSSSGDMFQTEFGSEQKDDLVRSMVDSLTMVVNDDNLLAKLVRNTKDSSLVVSGSLGNVLTGSVEESNNVGETITNSFKNAVENVDDIGVGVNIGYNSSDGFAISLPLGTKDDGTLKIGTPKVGVKAKKKISGGFSISKIIPFVKFKAGYENKNSNMTVIAQVTDRNSTTKFKTKAVSNFEKYFKKPLGIETYEA